MDDSCITCVKKTNTIMPTKSFDPTFKALVELGPEDWTALTGLRRAPTTIIDADIATVSGAADKVLHVADTTLYLLHLDFQAGHDSARLAPLLLQRNVLLHVRHGLPVRTVAVLLRPEADSPMLTGRLEIGLAEMAADIVFRYQVLRVWQMPAEEFFQCGLSLLPLATVADVTEGRLPAIIERIEGRLSEPEARAYSNLIWSATDLVMGLRYPPDVVHHLLRGIMGIEESTTYQEILQKGEARGITRGALDEARKMLLKQGKERFGRPDNQVKAALAGLVELDEVERLLVKLLRVSTWEELFGLPHARRKKGSN